jgi:hypothetical protein
MPRRMRNKQAQAAAVLLLLVLLLDPYVSLTVGASKGLDRHLLREAGDQPGVDIATAPAATPATAAAGPPAAANVAAATPVGPTPGGDDPAAATAAAAGVDTSVEATTLAGGSCRPGCGWLVTRCYNCRAGWYSPGGRHPRCLPCPIGTVSRAGSSRCTPCKDLPGKGLGFTTWSRGSTTCAYCKPGYAGAGCEQCHQGTWSHGGRANDRLKCVACSEGWTTAAAGATSPSACSREWGRMGQGWVGRRRQLERFAADCLASLLGRGCCCICSCCVYAWWLLLLAFQHC